MAALALNRKLRSTLGEAVDAGYLGVIHHLVGQRDSAREAYDRVLRVMEAQAPPRLRALFYAWSGGLAAEAGEARADNDFAVAREAAATSSERSVQRTVGLLEGIGRARAAPVERADDLLAEEATDRDLDVGLARRRLEAVLMQGAEE